MGRRLYERSDSHVKILMEYKRENCKKLQNQKFYNITFDIKHPCFYLFENKRKSFKIESKTGSHLKNATCFLIFILKFSWFIKINFSIHNFFCFVKCFLKFFLTSKSHTLFQLAIQELLNNLLLFSQ